MFKLLGFNGLMYANQSIMVIWVSKTSRVVNLALFGKRQCKLFLGGGL